MSNFPAIPLDQKTEKNVKLFLDGLAGRMGIEGRAVTYQDLFDAGMIQLKDGVTLANIHPGTNPGDVVEVPTEELPQNPTTPYDLATAGSMGAIFLTWDYDAYNDEYGTEIWRSPVDDRVTASLIAVSTGRAYTDNVGEKKTYFYWVRNRSSRNIVSGYNLLLGSQGSSNMIMTAEELFLTNPDLDFSDQPFTVVDLTPSPAPDRTWVIVLNGQVIMQGDLSIGQLTTGGVRPNTVFTLGDGVIELGSDSLNDAYALFAGLGGIAENDYLRITNGTINAYVYDLDNNQHILYKSLRHWEASTTQHAVQTLIPGYFKSPPEVYISFEDITVYNHLHPDQDQTLLMNVGPISLVSGTVGSYSFTPTATLVLSNGVQTELEPYNVYLVGINTATYTSLYTFLEAEGVSVNFTVGSAKVTTSGDYQNRIITVYVDGSRDGGAYSQIGTGFANLTGDGVDQIIVVNIPSITKGDWKFKYRFVAADRAGTTPGGADQYNYDQRTITTGSQFTLENNPSNNSISQLIQADVPAMDTGWLLYAIDFSVNYTREAEGWILCYGDCIQQLQKVFQGEGNSFIPNASPETITDIGLTGGPYTQGLCNTYLPITDHSYDSESDSGTTGTNGKIFISDDQEPYASGRYSNVPAKVDGESVASLITGHNGCLMGASKGTLSISGYNVIYYYRKPIVYSTTPTNHFQVNSVTANLGAQDISLSAATINYLAVGE